MHIITPTRSLRKRMTRKKEEYAENKRYVMRLKMKCRRLNINLTKYWSRLAYTIPTNFNPSMK